ncbi:Ig-like domain repeat protein, partial [Candidatus Bathyarchaeota archaeon]|nr:Ig-like domain repeat protein [Candidatus Bathyarchaeota archaeon]
GTVSSGASSMQIDVTIPRVSTSISCSVSPSTVTIGGSVIVSGVVSPAVGGVMVILTYTKPDASSSTRIVATSQNGAYSDIYTPDQLGSYSVIASWSGDDNCKEATSSPPLPHVKVMLSYRVKGSSWMPLRNLTTNPEGQFNYVWVNTPSSGGEYELMASWLGDDYYDGSSCTVLFIVTEIINPPASDFSIIIEEPYSTSVSDEQGKNVTVTLPAPNFTIAVDPKIVRLPRVSGYNTIVTIRISSLSNYTIELLLQINGIPEAIKARLYSEALRIQSFDFNSTILVISTGESPPEEGNYSIVIACSCMNFTASESVTLNIVDRIPTVIRVNAAPASIQYGDVLSIKGMVWPPHQANILVSIMLKNETEIDAAEFSTDERGEFSFSTRIMLAPDEYIIKVLCKGDAFHFGSVINLALRVVRASVIITLISNNTKVSLDEPVFFSGIVTTAKGELIQNMNLTILISGETGTIIVPAKTNENGIYTAVISKLSTGKYDVVSLIDGNNYYEPARSIPVKIEVLHPVSRTLNDILYPFVSMALIILALITSIRVIVSTMYEIKEERNYRANRKRYKK